MGVRVADTSRAVLLAQLEVERAEKQQWAARAMRAMARCDELEDDLRMWRLRFRLRHWTVQIPPELGYVPPRRTLEESNTLAARPERTPDEVEQIIDAALEAGRSVTFPMIPHQRRAALVARKRQPTDGVPLGVRVPGRKPGL